MSKDEIKLNDRLQDLIDEIGGNIDYEDLEALSHVSVKQLIQLWERLSNGVSKEQALEDMKKDAVERRRKQIKEERTKIWEDAKVFHQKEKDTWSVRKEYVVEKKNEISGLLQKSGEKIELSETLDGISEELKEALLKEKNILQNASVPLEKMEQLLVDSETLLADICEVDEDLSNQDSILEISPLEAKRKELEEKYDPLSEQYEEFLKEFDTLQSSRNDLQVEIERLEDSCPPEYFDDGDMIFDEPETLNDVPDEVDETLSEEKPNPIDNAEDDFPTSEDDDLPPSDGDLPSTDDDLPDDLPSSEDDDPLENEPPSTEIEKEESQKDSNEVDDEALASMMEASESEDSQAQKKNLRTVPEQRIDISDLDTRAWMRPRFDVTKFDPKRKLLSKKSRTWELDFFGGLFVNMSRKGQVKKSHTPGKLIQLEKNVTDLKRIRMRFFDANHSYELQFSSNYMRERFFECASAIRPKHYVWCPTLCIKNEGKTKTELFGSFTMETPKDGTKQITGKCNVNVTSKPYETLQIWVGSWNMQGKHPPKDLQVIRQWMPPNKYDIYAAGIQESGFPKDDRKIRNYIQRVLGRDYITLATQTLNDITLIVLTRKKHGMKVTNIHGGAKAIGSVNLTANKGTTGIALSFNETNIFFCTSHFISNTGDKTPNSENDHTHDRNKSFSDSVAGLKIGNPNLDLYSKYHYIFWMGDLNYRIEQPFQQALEMAKRGDFEELMKHDQLQKELRKNKVFSGFTEAPITFPPTYKYRKGKNEYRMSKKRTPSYCDRILFKALPGCSVANLKYGSCVDLDTSDHRPVYGTFKINTIRPYASIFTPIANRVDITFGDIHLSGRPETKVIQKPTLTFAGHYMESYLTTPKETKSSNPIFQKKNLPTLCPNTPDLEYLRVQHIALVVKDAGLKSGDFSHTHVCSGVLSLKPAIQNIGEDVSFKIPVYFSGRQSGELSGSIKITVTDKPLKL